jgi:hypothetical protein
MPQSMVAVKDVAKSVVVEAERCADFARQQEAEQRPSLNSLLDREHN